MINRAWYVRVTNPFEGKIFHSHSRDMFWKYSRVIFSFEWIKLIIRENRYLLRESIRGGDLRDMFWKFSIQRGNLENKSFARVYSKSLIIILSRVDIFWELIQFGGNFRSSAVSGIDIFCNNPFEGKILDRHSSRLNIFCSRIIFDSTLYKIQ